MLERSSEIPQERRHATSAATVRRALAVAFVAAAAVVFLVRLPATFDDLDSRASVNAKQSPIGRTIQAADGLGIEDQFAVEALMLLPQHATYVVAEPSSPKAAQTYGISPTTLLALDGYMRFLLLPRREVSPSSAQYLLCYACDTDPFDKRGLKRLWTDPHGFVIGRIES
jgi:hypothetical protein